METGQANARRDDSRRTQRRCRAARTAHADESRDRRTSQPRSLVRGVGLAFATQSTTSRPNQPVRGPDSAAKNEGSRLPFILMNAVHRIASILAMSILASCGGDDQAQQPPPPNAK